MIYGVGSEIIKHHMEIRGLGIINIKDLFGIAAVRDAKKIELVVELVEWNEEEEYDRLGVEELRYRSSTSRCRCCACRFGPGRNITSIIEVAARNQLLKNQGHHSAREFQDGSNRALIEAQAATRTPSRGTRSSERASARCASSSSPGSRAPARARRCARSRTSATSASTTCRCR